MNRAPKKAKKSRQFFASTGPQPASMSPIIFSDISNQTWIYPLRMWFEIYEFISIANPSNKPPPKALRDDDEYSSEIDIYDDELVKILRSKIHKVAAKTVSLPIMDVMRVATHVSFPHLTIVVENGKDLGSLTLENFQNIYHLKPAKARCNKEYLDNFYIDNLKAYVLMNPWYQEEEYFKDRAGISKYPTISFIPLVQYLMAMQSWLH
jgi:hypothetical protein